MVSLELYRKDGNLAIDFLRGKKNYRCLTEAVIHPAIFFFLELSWTYPFFAALAASSV